MYLYHQYRDKSGKGIKCETTPMCFMDKEIRLAEFKAKILNEFAFFD